MIPDNDISSFGSPTDLGTVDFTTARKLRRTGSTCDAYECTLQRRHVFVKRLKAEYRNNPVYLAAFDKEYDVGVGLDHVSLPRYVAFGGEYIVIDYVEGDTLDSLIKARDPRLNDRSRVKRVLLELVDVISYLHRRGVVHCDIKPDNIIVSPYDSRPITLIDFDKAYTSWLETTHGDTTRFGCEGCADGIIDFKALGLIASQLGCGRVATICESDGVTADKLRNALSGHRQRNILIAAATFMVMGAGVLLYLAWPFGMAGENNPSPVTHNADTVMEPQTATHATTDSVIPAPDKAAMPATPGFSGQDIAASRPATSSVAATENVTGLDRAWLDHLIKVHADSICAAAERARARLNLTPDSPIPQSSMVKDVIEAVMVNENAMFTQAYAHHSDVDQMSVVNYIQRNSDYKRARSAVKPFGL